MKHHSNNFDWYEAIMLEKLQTLRKVKEWLVMSQQFVCCKYPVKPLMDAEFNIRLEKSCATTIENNVLDNVECLYNRTIYDLMVAQKKHLMRAWKHVGEIPF